MDTLTKGDLTLHDTYWKLPVELIYTKLLYDKEVRDFQKALKTIQENAIKSRHTK